MFSSSALTTRGGLKELDLLLRVDEEDELLSAEAKDKLLDVKEDT